MIAIRDRLLNAQKIIQGPYQKISTVQLRIYSWSFLEGAATHSTTLHECKHGVSFEQLQKRGIHANSGERNQLELRFPVDFTLKQATLLGWETLWAGSRVRLKHPAGQSHFEVSLPPQGWWRLENESCSIDFHSTLISQSNEEPQVPFSQRLRELFRSPAMKWATSALICHILLFVSLTHFDQWSHKLLNVLTPETETQEEPEQQAVQIVMTDSYDPTESSFQGRSLFPAMAQKAEAQTQPTEISNKLKNLANLFGSQPSLPAAGQRRSGQSGQNPSALPGGFKSLQSGLLAQQGTGTPGGTGTGRGGPREVHWKSQFASGSGGKGLTEGQAQMLSETFAKKQDQFRACYESALLQFEELAVTVSFEAEINKEGFISKPHFTLSGRYTSDSQNHLLDCLKQTVSKIKVDSKLSGIKIKNQFIFKS